MVMIIISKYWMLANIIRKHTVLIKDDSHET